MLESKLFSALQATTYITDTVSDRVYPVQMPQDATLPCITYQRMGSPYEYHLRGYATLQRVFIQVDVWGPTFKQTREFSTVVARIINAATAFSAKLDSDADLAEQMPDGEWVYRVTQDWSIWNRE